MRILGIDLGTTSVKAVELDSAFGRYEVHEYHELKIAAGENPLEVARTLIASLPKPPDRIVAALRTQRSTFRNLSLPTRDKKAIQASVGFELDDELPFPLEETVYDYSVLSTVGQISHVHVAATLREHLLASVAEWNSAGIDPDLITTEAWAYRALFNKMGASPTPDAAPVLLVQVGHDHTTLYIHLNGTPILAREIPLGGRDLTASIQNRYNVPADQAEAAKLDNGFVLPPSQRAQATAEQIEFSDTLLPPLMELVREIRHANLTCKNITHQSVGTIHLAGGSSLLPGMARLIEEELNVPVRPLQALSAIATSGVTYSEPTDASFGLAAALALCLVGSERSSAINLRKGEFAKLGQSRGLNMANLRRPLAALAVITASLFLSLFVQNQVYKSRLKTTDAQLEKSIRSFFGQLAPSAIRTYMSNTSTLKARINQELTRTRESATLMGENAKSPLNFLKEMSLAIPKDVVLDMVNFQVGASPAGPYNAQAEGQASLTFLVNNPQMAERLAGIVDRKMTGVQRSKIDEVPGVDGAPKRLKITFTGKPTEDSYGK